MPSALFAQTLKELPCKTVEEAKNLLDKERARTAALRTELEYRLAEAQAVAAAAPADHADQTILMRFAADGVRASIGSGTVIGCSRSESQPGKYACFIFTVAHFFKGEGQGGTPIDPSNFTVTGKALFEDGEPAVKGLSIKIIGIDREHDVAIGLMYVDEPLPAAPLPPRGYVPPLGAPVMSAGCSSDVPRPYGESDTCIIAVTPKGVLKTNCAPKEGDSGGGIYDESGHVIGTCMSFSELKDGTPLNIGNYAPAEHAYNLVDGLREHAGWTNIGFDKDGYLKVIPKPPRRITR